MTDSLPVIEPTDLDGVPESELPSVAGILLAAGTGSRFGSSNKLLTTGDGEMEPVVRQATTALIESGVDPVHVVTGHEATHVQDALSDLPVTFAHNPEYETGQASSVRVGIDSLPESTDAVVIALGDMPSVDPDSIDQLVEAFAAGNGTALTAGYRGQRGNPVLFGRSHFAALRTLTGDMGGRDILLNPATDAAIVETGDLGVRHDIDIPDDVGVPADVGVPDDIE